MTGAAPLRGGRAGRIVARWLIAGAGVLGVSAAEAQSTVQPAASAPLSAAALFEENCSACHQLNGKGVPGAFPALAGDALVDGPPAGPVSVVLKGRGGMPTFAGELSDRQIGAILTYVRASWGNHAPAIDPEAVAKIRGASAVKPPATLTQAH